MKHLLFILSFCFVSVMLNAQDKEVAKIDHIVFVNGTKMSGKILNITKKYVTIKFSNVPFTFHKSRLSEIHYQGLVLPMSKKKLSNDSFEYEGYEFAIKTRREPLKQGFYNITYGNIIFGANRQFDGYYYGGGDAGIGIANVTGVQLSQYVGLGLGVGYMSYGYNGKNIPVYTEFRGYMSRKKQSAYYNVAIGATFGNIDENRGYTSTKPGSYLHPSLGYKFGSDTCAFMLDLGLQFSTVTYISDTPTYFASELFQSQRVVLRLGIML